MSKTLQLSIALLLLLAAVFWSFYGTRPAASLEEKPAPDQFSVARAFSHVEAIAEQPHYVGSPAHREVRNYIVSELEEMGLLVHTQDAWSLNREGVFTRPQNIVSRIEGSGDGQALLLLTHYDSAMHSSFGASDAASGIGTILEGLRTFLVQNKKPVNDIIVLFTDAEELGLNGAEIFANEHPWAKDVKLALNFESRGSGGNSFMLLETTEGNEALVREFFEADVNYPVTSSLYYSIYKMLPNDTDLTVFREQAGVNGYNFAFIDDHFDYHTATDIPENLDIKSLAHQGSYLMPLLNHFSSQALEGLSSGEELIFFNLPFLKLVTYPFAWIYPMFFLAVIVFVVLLFYGGFRRKFSFKNVLKGFIPLFLSLLISAVLAYLFWQLLLIIYPEYSEMEQGFTYNGYWYIAAVIFLSLAVCFYVYHRFRKPQNTAELFIAPLVLWILINLLVALYLKGAAYFILLVFFGLVQLFFLLYRTKYTIIIMAFLSLPAIFILMPLVSSLPVALGLKSLFLSAIFTILLWVLLLPVFGFSKKIQLAGFLCSLIFFGIFITAHFKSGFNEERPKPNSLVYVLDDDKGEASWNSYDKILDAYTAPYFSSEEERTPEAPVFSSKYYSAFKRTAPAPQIMLPKPFIKVEKTDSSNQKADFYRVKIAPNRDINRIDLLADKAVDFLSFKVNGKEAGNLQPGESDLHIFKNRWSDMLLTYYAVNRDTLRLEIGVEKGLQPRIELYESSFDLAQQEQLNVRSRTAAMIPRPFVLNDAVVIKKNFILK